MKSIGVKPMVQGDLLPNRDSVLLASPELASVLTAAFGEAECLDCAVFDPKKKESKPYVISTPKDDLQFNPLDETQILARVSELNFDFSKIPDGIQLLAPQRTSRRVLSETPFR